MRGYPTQNPNCRNKIGKDAIQRVTYGMRMKIHCQEYLNAEQASEECDNPSLPSNGSVNPAPRFEP
jgi:hypothetical protein